MSKTTLKVIGIILSFFGLVVSISSILMEGINKFMNIVQTESSINNIEISQYSTWIIIILIGTSVAFLGSLMMIKNKMLGGGLFLIASISYLLGSMNADIFQNISMFVIMLLFLLVGIYSFIPYKEGE